jgi:O-antigen ligase
MQMGFSIIKDHPFLGVGTGNFQSVYPRYLTAGAPHAPHFPHNSFLQIWIENGTLGFLVYLGLYLVAIKNLWTVIRTSKVRELETIAVALLGALFGLGFFALTANVLEHEVYWILFAFTVIVLNLHQRTGIQT